MMEPSAKKLSGPTSMSSGAKLVTVDNSARGPIPEPISRSQGDRYSVVYTAAARHG
jgi:hypothetical protein